MLSHWVRSDAELPDYPFARFSRRADVVRYTDDEYAVLCAPSEEAQKQAQATPKESGASIDQDVRWLKVCLCTCTQFLPPVCVTI